MALSDLVGVRFEFFCALAFFKVIFNFVAYFSLNAQKFLGYMRIQDNKEVI